MSKNVTENNVSVWLKRMLVGCLALLIALDTSLGYAQGVVLPEPGLALNLSGSFRPALLKGMVIHPQDPFRFDFIVQRGDLSLAGADREEEYQKLIKYFLAALAIPDKDQWVNLSPYEQNRIIPDSFGVTVMGRDLLAQDYLLKQLTASLINPDTELGKKFWDGVYAEVYRRFGQTDVPTDTFNKVWIIPDRAAIYQKGQAAYVTECHLKVLTDTDYLAQKENTLTQVDGGSLDTTAGVQAVSNQIMREVIVPAIEKEVNEGKNFALLRQVYSAMLLATWYKRTLKETILAGAYVDRGKVKGIDQDPAVNQGIYEQYVSAFKQGVLNVIREDRDRLTQEIIPRKYFSGGASGFGQLAIERAESFDASQFDYDARESGAGGGEGVAAAAAADVVEVALAPASPSPVDPTPQPPTVAGLSGLKVKVELGIDIQIGTMLIAVRGTRTEQGAVPFYTAHIYVGENSLGEYYFSREPVESFNGHVILTQMMLIGASQRTNIISDNTNAQGDRVISFSTKSKGGGMINREKLDGWKKIMPLLFENGFIKEVPMPIGEERKYVLTDSSPARAQQIRQVLSKQRIKFNDRQWSDVWAILQGDGIENKSIVISIKDKMPLVNILNSNGNPSNIAPLNAEMDFLHAPAGTVLSNWEYYVFPPELLQIEDEGEVIQTRIDRIIISGQDALNRTIVCQIVPSAQSGLFDVWVGGSDEMKYFPGIALSPDLLTFFNPARRNVSAIDALVRELDKLGVRETLKMVEYSGAGNSFAVMDSRGEVMNISLKDSEDPEKKHVRIKYRGERYRYKVAAQSLSAAEGIRNLVKAVAKRENIDIDPSQARMANVQGGIDLAQSHLDLQIKRDGNGMVLPASQQDFTNIRIDGLVPHIIRIESAASSPVLADFR